MPPPASRRIDDIPDAEGEAAVEGAPRPPAGVLERGIAILEAFTPQRLRLSLRELADLTGLDKATLLRLLAVLTRSNLLQRLESGQYAPGPALLHLGMLYRSTFDLGERLQPVLREVMRKTGETVAFYVRSGDERVCLYRENSHREVRHHVEPGMRLPLSAGGSSAHILQYYTGGTGGRHAKQIQQHGYVATRGERVPEMTSVAVPVFEPEQGFVGSLVIMGLASRHDTEAQMKGLEEARLQLALQGFATEPPPGWQRPRG